MTILDDRPGGKVTGRGPAPLPLEPDVELPRDSLAYRVKCRLLGPPLHTEQLEHERLGKPTALAVFASDNLSSSAYATEEILRVLVPAVGVAAFALVVPITVAMLAVLAVLILSYRQTIKAYPTAGGAYMVTRDNFGLMPAQVAGVALLTDYVLTVAVSVAAGVAALVSAFGALAPLTVPLSIAFILIISFGNLRGVRESGRIFAIPTYFFIVNMVVLIGVGLAKMATGTLPTASHNTEGIMPFGHSGDGVLLGASMFVVLHAFASGGAAVTGVEAISNGVTAFKKPEWKNARHTLVVMGSLLGAMFLGLSVMAAHMKVAPYEKGTPTVISQVGKLAYGTTPLGHLLFLSLQAGTMLILVLAANTSFADFPRLASFHAGDNFMPRQLIKRGHRLVLSNGILFLAGSSILLILVTEAKVDRLIPLYAIGVFTSFTLSQAGMARHHLREKEPGWRSGFVINGVGAVLTLVVDIVIAITKFTHGAWVIVVLVPIMVVFLVRLARQYEMEAEQLEHDVPAAVAAPILRRHVVLVFVDRLDMAGARAIQYARTLMPDELRAVHFVLDHDHAEDLRAAWVKYGLNGIVLDLVDCPDRRLTHAAMEVVARDLAPGDTEVSVLLPERKYNGVWHRILHDRTADAIERDVSRLAHANVTTVPFHFAGRRPRREAPAAVEPVAAAKLAPPSPNGDTPAPVVEANGCTPIATVRYRQHVCIEGRVRTVRVQPLAGSTTMECVIEDETGAMSIVFYGRPKIAGIGVGARLRATGTAAQHHGRLTMLNPAYELLAKH
ncbi:MAG TPA: amino acid permease [Acidimicrobiales bacterium]|nr:amino acid permease [Acidimicrobiales bacterium]